MCDGDALMISYDDAAVFNRDGPFRFLLEGSREIGSLLNLGQAENKLSVAEVEISRISKVERFFDHYLIF